MKPTLVCTVVSILMLAGCAEPAARIVADTFCLRAKRIDARPLAGTPGALIEIGPTGWSTINALTRQLAEQIDAHNRKVDDCQEQAEDRGR